jgi:hypothetical protein
MYAFYIFQYIYIHQTGRLMQILSKQNFIYQLHTSQD